MYLEKLPIAVENSKKIVGGKLWNFLLTHLGVRPDESVSPEDQWGGVHENPFPRGLGDEEIIELRNMFNSNAKEEIK